MPDNVKTEILLQDEIRARIIPGKVTGDDIARAAGVSPSTISRIVLHGKGVNGKNYKLLRDYLDKTAPDKSPSLSPVQPTDNAALLMLIQCHENTINDLRQQLLDAKNNILARITANDAHDLETKRQLGEVQAALRRYAETGDRLPLKRLTGTG